MVRLELLSRFRISSGNWTVQRKIAKKVERGHLRTLLALPGDGRGSRKEGRRGPVYQEQEQRGSIIDHLVEARARNQGARSEASVCEIPMPLLHSLRKCKNGTLRMLVSLLGYRKPCPRSSRSASPASLLFHLHTYTGVYTVCVNLYDLTAKSSPSSQSTTMMPL